MGKGFSQGVWCGCCGIIRDKTACPVDFRYKDERRDAFDYLTGLREDKEGFDGECGKARETVCNRDSDRPHKARVEQDGDQDFTAGTKREIRRVSERHNGCTDTENDKHKLGESIDSFGDAEHKRENGRKRRHQTTENHTDHDGERHHLFACIACFLDLACAEQVADDEGDGEADTHPDDTDKVMHRDSDRLRRDDIESTRCIRLVTHRDSERPEKFVEHQG